MLLGNSLFHGLGYQVLSLFGGVYLLEAADSHEKFTAILRAESSFPLSTPKVSLVLSAIEPGVLPTAVTQHWLNIDARRLGGPDITVVEIQLPPGAISSAQLQTGFARPGGAGVRYVTELTTGDVVCFN